MVAKQVGTETFEQRRLEVARRIERRKTPEDHTREESILATRRASTGQRDPVPVSDQLLLQRAVAAYYRTADQDGVIAEEPSRTISGVESNDGLDYVVLRNANGVLAAYRIRANGPLRRLKRWPSALEDY